MFFEIYNPNPVPLSEVVENFENSLGLISGSMPVPLSIILTIQAPIIIIAIVIVFNNLRSNCYITSLSKFDRIGY